MPGESSWKAAPSAWRRVKDAAREHRKQPTPAEVALWDILRDRRSLGLKFRRQHAIGPYIVDFYCPAERLIIELDGSAHDSERAAGYDQSRERYLRGIGLTVIRLENRHVIENLEGVLAYVDRHFRHP